MKVIVVGGSLGGLFAAVALKKLKQGHDIRILERSPKRLHDQGAGIVAGEETTNFFERFDASKTPITVDSPMRHYLDLQGKEISKDEWPQRMTSWDLMYNVLRWNFDGDCDEGFVFEKAANGEAHAMNGEQSGSATYSLGCTVRDIQEVKDADGKSAMEVVFTDSEGQEQRSVVDLVVGADGPGSTVRSLMDPTAVREYVGYVIWRGTIPEAPVSDEAHEAFVEKFTFFHGPGIQILAYVIPGKFGALEPGKRIINWAWYNNYPEGSAEHKELMTDVDGKTHHITLPPGKMNPDVWQRQQEYSKRVLPPQFAEIVCRANNPFIQAVTDVIAKKSAFYDGKVVLVGDALAGFRPHTAASTSQAALDSYYLHDMLKGEFSLAEWEKLTMEYATRVQRMGVEMGNRSQFSKHPMACATGGR